MVPTKTQPEGFSPLFIFQLVKFPLKIEKQQLKIKQLNQPNCRQAFSKQDHWSEGYIAKPWLALLLYRHCKHGKQGAQTMVVKALWREGWDTHAPARAHTHTVVVLIRTLVHLLPPHAD